MNACSKTLPKLLPIIAAALVATAAQASSPEGGTDRRDDFLLAAPAPGDPLLIVSHSASDRPADGAEGAQEVFALGWLCLDDMSCADAAAPQIRARPQEGPALIPAPAALVLLGTAMTAFSLFLRRGGASG